MTDTDADRGAGAPTEQDERHDDLEFNPQLDLKRAKAWINLIEESEDAFEKWNDHCDRIDKQYASLERLANMARDKEFQMFWANAEVIKPSIYAKPPTPVIVPKFKDRRPVYQAASEVMERCAVVAFDLAHINDLMLQIRDDVALIDRGVAWCRYESGKDEGYYSAYEKVCIDFKHRRDFLHSVSRAWPEVTWVAAASYLTRAEARKRFRKHSGDEYQDAEYKVDKEHNEIGGADARERAKFWEIWDKSNRRVIWIAKGCEYILDEDDAHLELQDFFPCPKPAYGTTQRGSLVPVPDVMQYKDQLDEVNMLTGRIHALSDALEVKGFYPAGGAELSDAIQSAIAIKTPGRILVPISNWAAFGGSKEVLIWLPIDMIATTITALVDLRRQVIEDIYQIMGLSDIMRGATDARETLGAQQLKSQYGSTRIRDKQQELVRFARDLVRIVSEIITEKFDPVTIIEMSQTQLPTQEMQRQEAMQLAQQIQQQEQQLGQAKQMLQQAQQGSQPGPGGPPPGPPPPPGMMPPGGGPPPGAVPISGPGGGPPPPGGAPPAPQGPKPNPDAINQLIQQGEQTIETGKESMRRILSKPTIEQVLHFLKDNRAKAFTLDIETDSTIMIDENAEKERRTEFVGMLGQLIPQLAQLVGSDPASADFAGEILKFSVAPFRAGRSLDGAIDEYVEHIKGRADKPRPDDPVVAQNKTALEIEKMKDATNKEKNQLEMQAKQAELQMRNQHEQAKIASNERMKAAELQARQQDDAARARQTNLKAMADREKHQADLIKKNVDMRTAMQKAEMAQRLAVTKHAESAQRADAQRAAQQFKGFPT